MFKDYKKTIGYIKLVVVILVWGGVYHVAKFLVENANIYTVSFLRFIFASVFLLTIYFKKHSLRIGFERAVKHWKMLLLIGFVGIFIYNMFFLGAEALISANNVAILYAFTPCVTVLLGSIFLKHKINKLSYVGIVIALIGTIGVISLSDAACGRFFCKSTLSHFSLGQILAILASITMAIYSLLNKQAASKYGIDSLTIIAFGTFFGMLFLLIPFILWGDSILEIIHKPWSFWWAMFYLSILATVVCYTWYSDAIHEIGVGQTVVFQNGVPLSAVLIGTLILHDHISFKVLMSGAVIVLGVLITNFAASRR